MENLAWRVDYIKGNERPYYEGAEGRDPYFNNSVLGTVLPYKTALDIVGKIKHFTGVDLSSTLEEVYTTLITKGVEDLFRRVYIVDASSFKNRSLSSSLDEELLEKSGLDILLNKSPEVGIMVEKFGLTETPYESLLGYAIFGARTEKNFLRAVDSYLMLEELRRTGGRRIQKENPYRLHEVLLANTKSNGKNGNDRTEKSAKLYVVDPKEIVFSRRREARRTAREYGKVYLDPEQWNPELVESFLPKKPAAPFISIPPIRDRIEEIRDTITPLNEIAGMEFLHTLKLAERVSEIVYSRDF